MSILSKQYFHDEGAAFEYVESVLWPNGPVCPKCGSAEKSYDLARTRIGLRKCASCRKQFTVRVGTIFESSHIALNKWLQAVYLMCASKKGISAHQLHRVLEVTYKTAWFLAHRIREAMRSGELQPMGGKGEIIEVDETFIGNDKTKKPKGSKKGRGYSHKHKVLTLVSRSGEARSFHVDSVNAKTLFPIIQKNIASESIVMTDEAGQYTNLGQHYPHEFVRHGKSEYVRGNIHTNTIEGFFSIFKRGMKGVYQHCKERHLHRYLAEFDFRYNLRNLSDIERSFSALMGVVGKRLLYHDSLLAT